MNKINVYYSGMDSESQPFNTEINDASKIAVKHIDYIKALCLVSDKVIIPPSFHAYWVGTNGVQDRLSELIDIYNAGYVSSSVHSSMGTPLDFISYKLLNGSPKDIKYINQNRKVLDQLFKEMPLVHRNEVVQSNGFTTKISNALKKYPSNNYANLLIQEKIIKPYEKGGIITTREEINKYLVQGYTNQEINYQRYKKYLYLTNQCYYIQGSETYDAIISTLNAKRYVSTGQYMFSCNNGIQLGYNPEVILGILYILGITGDMISQLSIKDMRSLRESDSFDVFKKNYYAFSSELQKFNLNTSRISKEKICKIESDIKNRFLKDFFAQSKKGKNNSDKIGMKINIISTIILGAVGFFIIPIIGASLGTLPTIADRFNVKDRISNKLYNSENFFLAFIQELHKITEKIPKKT